MNEINIKRLKKWLEKQSSIASEEYQKTIQDTKDYVRGEDMNRKKERKIKKLIEEFKNSDISF